VIANHVLISIFELGSKVFKIVTTKSVTTKTCLEGLIVTLSFWTHNPFIWRNRLHLITVMQYVLVCKIMLKFCKVMRLHLLKVA